MRSPSPARTQADSPASSYRSTRPAFPPIEKWTVTSPRQALANSDIQAPLKSTKAELYELYKNLKPNTLSPKITPKATRKRKHTVSPRWTPPSSSRSTTSSHGVPNSGTRPSASQGRTPDFADARPAEDPSAAQPSDTASQSAIPKPITQTGFWPPPPPDPAPQPTPFCPEPAAEVNAWPQWTGYVASQPAPPGPGPVAQASTWLERQTLFRLLAPQYRTPSNATYPAVKAILACSPPPARLKPPGSRVSISRRMPQEPPGWTTSPFPPTSAKLTHQTGGHAHQLDDV